MYLIGHRHNLICKVKAIMEQAVFLHNRVFLDYEGEEKQEALEKLENVVKNLGQLLEECKVKSIEIEKMDEEYNIYKNMYEDILEDYSWINKFNLYDGYKPEYLTF